MAVEVIVNGNTYSADGRSTGRDMVGADGYGHTRWLLPMLLDNITEIGARQTSIAEAVATALGHREAAAISAQQAETARQGAVVEIGGLLVVAQSHRDAAADSAAASGDSATLAQDWAVKTDGEVSAGEYSAKHHAQLAASAAQAAAESAASVAGGPVTSVNGKTGIAVLSAADVGAEPALTSATLAEMQAGDEAGRRAMSPQDVRAAIEAQVPALTEMLEVGDLLFTARTLAPPAWLPALGGVVSKSAYPALDSLIADVAAPVTKLSDPAALPSGTGNGVAFSADGMYMAVAHTTAPYLTVYKRSGDTFTKLADPAALPTGTGGGVAFSADGTYMAVAHNTSPYLTVYKRSGDTFDKLANPAALPTGQGYGVAFSADGTYMAVAHNTSPYLTVYKRSGDTFIKLADPAALPTGTGNGVAFSADGTYMAVAHATAPYLTVYKRSGDTFAKLADPAVLPAGTGNGVAFSADGTYMAVAHTAAPYLTVYKRSGDTFIKLADPAALPAGQGRGAAFSSDGVYLAVAHNTSPYLTVYKRSGDTFIKLANPATLPTGNGNGVAFHFGPATFLDNFLVVAHSTTPFVTIYRDGYAYDPVTEFQVPDYSAVVNPATNVYIRATP